MTTNIRLRGSAWYLRVSVPRDLQPILGKKEVWKSLRTGDHKEARRRHHAELDALNREWDALRSRRQLSASDIEHAIWDRYVELIDADERFRSQLPTDEDLDEIWEHLTKESGDESIEAFRVFEIIRGASEENRQARTERLKLLREHAARGETRSVADVTRRTLAKRGLEVANSADHKRLALGLQRAELEAHRRFLERDEGDFTGEPGDKLVRRPKLSKEPVVPVGETIMGLFDRYQRENPASLRPDTWDQNRKIVALFADFAGSKSHVSVITRKVMRDWKARLFEWPAKASQIGAFSGLGFEGIIKANQIAMKPTISKKTINKYLSALGSFCGYLKDNEFIVDDVTGLYLNLDRSEKKVVPFRDEQLNTMFSSPLFHRSGGDDLEHQTGDVRVRDWRYWLPLIGLYSGARLGEIAQLLVADVKEIDGHWCFHINEAGADKSVKTPGSERVVPIHSGLIRLGILDYRARVEREGQGSLFPEITADARGFMSGGPSKFFQSYFVAIGIKVDKSVNFHSFRHGIADAFRRAGFLDEEFGMLLGHVEATTTQRYGILKQGVMAKLVKMIEAVSFPNVPSLA